MDGPLACDAYDRGRKARSLVGRAVLYSSGFEESEVVGDVRPPRYGAAHGGSYPLQCVRGPVPEWFRRVSADARVQARIRSAPPCCPGCRRGAAGL